MTSTKFLNLALIGCGAVAELYYAPALESLSSCANLTVKMVYDSSIEKARFLSERLGHARIAGSLAEVCDSGCDLAIIATPPRSHAQISAELARSGMHVLCEKPMAASIADAHKMIESARQANSLLAVGLFRRFFPVHQAIKRYVSDGTFGKPKSINLNEGYPFIWPVRTASTFDQSSVSGGILLDSGSHAVDLLTWWFGSPLHLVYRDDAMGGLEANCQVEMQFAGGVTGKLTLSRDWQRPDVNEIDFEQAVLAFTSNVPDQLQITYKNNATTVAGTVSSGSQPGHRQPKLTYQRCFVNQLANVIGAVRGEEELVVPGDQALLGLEIIERCYQARELLDMPWFSPEEKENAANLTISRSSP